MCYQLKGLVRHVSDSVVEDRVVLRRIKVLESTPLNLTSGILHLLMFLDRYRYVYYGSTATDVLWVTTTGKFIPD